MSKLVSAQVVVMSFGTTVVSIHVGYIIHSKLFSTSESKLIYVELSHGVSLNVRRANI